MSWPKPVPGLVVRYAYLWEWEASQGRDEGVKDRPCAVVLVLLDADDQPQVRVLPITHSAPAVAEDALEIPPKTKARLRLDSDRSWVVLTEANDFSWPGPDLRPLPGKGPDSVVFGVLPPGFFRILRERLALRRRHAIVARSE